MAKICPTCEKENPNVAKFCMYCNTQLVEKEFLSEEDKLRKQLADQKEQLELLKKTRELEVEMLSNELQEAKGQQQDKLKKASKEQQTKVNENTKTIDDNSQKIIETEEIILPSTLVPPYTSSVDDYDTSNKKKILIILSLIVFIVFGGLLYSLVIQPSIKDKNAERYYPVVNINLRSSKDAGGDYNRIGSIPYGAELITYERDFDWSYVKYKDYDGTTKKGYVASRYTIDKGNFIRLNSIFGDSESKECINTAKCRLALLNYYIKNNLIGKISYDVLRESMPHIDQFDYTQWQVFCRDPKLKPNNVLYSRLFDANSKYTDFAVIIKNIDTEERKLLIFFFDDDETSHLVYEEDVYSDRYISNITTKYNAATNSYRITTKYSN